MKLKEIVKLSAETEVSLGTVKRWAAGGRVTDSNRKVLTTAAKELGIVLDVKEASSNAG